MQVGDLLFVRAGFVEAYHAKPSDERAALALRPHVHGPDDPQRWAGVSQEDEIIDWLHDCYFAAVAGDSPTFEAWPSQRERYLHEYILALWGEFFFFFFFFSLLFWGLLPSLHFLGPLGMFSHL